MYTSTGPAKSTSQPSSADGSSRVVLDIALTPVGAFIAGLVNGSRPCDIASQFQTSHQV